MAGLVVSASTGERFNKPGEKTSLRIKGEVFPYVSREEIKLAKALEIFTLSVKNKMVLDIGASTGGFTDVALQNGARLVYAKEILNF